MTESESDTEPESEVAPEVVPEVSSGRDSTDRQAPSRRQQLEKMIRDHAVQVELFLELAALHRAEDRPAEAKRVLEQAIEVCPEDARLVWQHEEAVLARSMQQLRQVRDLANRLDTAEVRRELQRSQDDWARRRIEVCKARLRRDPDRHSLRLAIAEALIDLEQFTDACEALLPCYEVDSLAPQARLLQGQCLTINDDLLGALAAYRAAALRRSLVVPAKVRVAALTAAVDLAKQLGLPLSQQRYAQALQVAEQELAAESATSAPSPQRPERATEAADQASS